MLPASRIAVPVFERFFEMELDGVDELIVRTLDHHLVATQVRAGQQLKPFRHAIELQSVILPDAQNATLTRVILPDTGLGIVDPGKDWIFRFNDTHKPILILSHAIRAALFLFLLVEGENASAEAQANQLMTTANAEYWSRRRVNEIGKAGEQFRVVVIEISERAT